jgi:hypothetical protein
LCCCRTRRHTQPRYHDQRQGQVGRFSDSHRSALVVVQSLLLIVRRHFT